jgi:hypothetical protein
LVYTGDKEMGLKFVNISKAVSKSAVGTPVLGTIGNVAISAVVNILIASIFEVVSARIKKGKKGCLVNCKK